MAANPLRGLSDEFLACRDLRHAWEEELRVRRPGVQCSAMCTLAVYACAGYVCDARRCPRCRLGVRVNAWLNGQSFWGWGGATVK